MKSFIMTLLVAMTLMTIFTACEKPDYQDPRYRSTHSK